MNQFGRTFSLFFVLKSASWHSYWNLKVSGLREGVVNIKPLDKHPRYQRWGDETNP